MPTVADIQILEIVGLAITDYVTGIPINKAWSFSLLDLELRKHFPQLFIYLDALPKTPNPNYKEHQEDIYRYLPPYHLCVKEKRKIAIAPGTEFPDGPSVVQNEKPNKRAGF